MRMFLIALAIATGLALSVPAQAGSRVHGYVLCTSSDACKTLHRGHARGRIPVACVHIPFRKRGYGQIALFVLRDFNPNGTVAQQQAQINDANNVVFKDSKITGPVDDFCRGAWRFAEGNWIVLCDEDRTGGFGPASLRYAIRYGHPPGNRRIVVGHLG